MAQDPPRTGSGSGSAGESRESLPRLTEVVPDYEELSPYYQRPSSAPAAGVDPNRPFFATSARDLERQHSDLPAPAHPTEAPLPPLRGSTIRTYPGAGTRLPYHPSESNLDQRPVGLNAAIERTQSDIPSRHSDVPNLSPSIPIISDPARGFESRHENLPTVYEPAHETQRRASRTHLPPIDVEAREAPPAPHFQPLPPLPRPTQSGPSGTYPLPSPRYNPYPTEHRPTHVHDPGHRRRYSQTLPRDFPRPQSPYQPQSPTLTGRPPPVYSPESYPPYNSYGRDTRVTRRTSLGTNYYEERRPSRQDSLRYPPPPYASSYPPQPSIEYVGGRYDPYHYPEYEPPRRLSQQETGEQVSHLGVPERYRPSMGTSSPSSIRVQPAPLSAPTSTTPGKRRGNLPKESKDKLKQWLSQHVDHPYPTEEEKKELAAEAGMTMGQINNWFINARRRTLPRIPGRSGSPSTSRTLRRRPGDS